MNAHDDVIPLGAADDEDEDRVVTLAGDLVGKIKNILWEDKTGVDVVGVHIAGRDVAIPVQHAELQASNRVRIAFGIEKVEAAPSVFELKQVGGKGAIDRLSEHFDIALGGPPPGPGTGSPPPWW